MSEPDSENGEARAAAPVRPLRLVYEAVPECPDRSAFMGQMLGRTGRVRFVGEGVAALHAAVFVRRTGNRYAGEIALEGGPPRLVSGDSCVDVVSALALIAALMVDAHAQASGQASAAQGRASLASSPPHGVETTSITAHLPAGSSAVGPAPPTRDRGSRTGSADATASTDATESAGNKASAEETATESKMESAEPAESVGPSASAEPFQLAARSAHAAADSGPARKASWFLGAGALLDVGRGLGTRAMTLIGPFAWIEARIVTRGTFAPTLRVGARYAMSPEVRPDAGAAHFTLLVGRFEVCPLRLEWHPAALVPCASFEAGTITGYARALPPIVRVHDESRKWMQLGQGIRLEIVVSTPLALMASLELREHLQRYTFAFRAPELEIAQVPEFELAGAAGAVVRFW